MKNYNRYQIILHCLINNITNHPPQLVCFWSKFINYFQISLQDISIWNIKIIKNWYRQYWKLCHEMQLLSFYCFFDSDYILSVIHNWKKTERKLWNLIGIFMRLWTISITMLTRMTDPLYFWFTKCYPLNITLA